MFFLEKKTCRGGEEEKWKKNINDHHKIILLVPSMTTKMSNGQKTENTCSALKDSSSAYDSILLRTVAWDEITWNIVCIQDDHRNDALKKLRKKFCSISGRKFVLLPTQEIN